MYSDCNSRNACQDSDLLRFDNTAMLLNLNDGFIMWVNSPGKLCQSELGAFGTS